MITNADSRTNIHEIADGIYRINTQRVAGKRRGTAEGSRSCAFLSRHAQTLP